MMRTFVFLAAVALVVWSASAASTTVRRAGGNDRHWETRRLPVWDVNGQKKFTTKYEGGESALFCGNSLGWHITRPANHSPKFRRFKLFIADGDEVIYTFDNIESVGDDCVRAILPVGSGRAQCYTVHAQVDKEVITRVDIPPGTKTVQPTRSPTTKSNAPIIEEDPAKLCYRAKPVKYVNTGNDFVYEVKFGNGRKFCEGLKWGYGPDKGDDINDERLDTYVQCSLIDPKEKKVILSKKSEIFDSLWGGQRLRFRFPRSNAEIDSEGFEPREMQGYEVWCGLWERNFFGADDLTGIVARFKVSDFTKAKMGQLGHIGEDNKYDASKLSKNRKIEMSCTDVFPKSANGEVDQSENNERKIGEDDGADWVYAAFLDQEILKSGPKCGTCNVRLSKWGTRHMEKQ